MIKNYEYVLRFTGCLKSAKRYSIFIYKLLEEKQKTKRISRPRFRLGDDAVREAINLCKFSNENILEIFGMCSKGSPFVIVTDLVNCTLLHYVRRNDVNFTSQEINDALIKVSTCFIRLSFLTATY